MTNYQVINNTISHLLSAYLEIQALAHGGFPVKRCLMDRGMDSLISVFRFLTEKILSLFCIFLKNTTGTWKHSDNLSGFVFVGFFEQKKWVWLSKDLAIGEEALGRTEVQRRFLWATYILSRSLDFVVKARVSFTKIKKSILIKLSKHWSVCQVTKSCQTLQSHHWL